MRVSKPAMDSGWNKFKGSVLLLVVSLCLSFVLAEIILRLFGYHGAPISFISNIYIVDDPILDWRYKANSEVAVGKVVYRYNRAGFRDVDHEVEKPSRIHRIVVLGDSVTEGYGVEWKDVFASVLQSRLGEKHEVINIAAGGLNTPQEVHLLKKEGLRYKPDLVVLNFVLNDADFFTSFKAAQRYEAEKDSQIGMLNLAVNPKVKRALKSSALIYFVKERVENLKGRLLGTEDSDYYSQLWANEGNRQKVSSGFRELAQLEKDHRFNVIVIIWPVLMGYSDYKFRSIHEWVAAEAANNGLAVLDLLRGFSRVGYRDLQITAEDNSHPNATGHQLGAEAFLAWYHSRTRGE